MTVSSTATRIAYTGNASTTAFAFSFRFLATTDIAVYLDGVLQSTGYTVSSPGASGTVTFSTAPASGVSVVITRATAKTQETDYVANDAFSADSTELAFDRAMLAAQDNAAAIGRSLRVADHLPAIAPIADPDDVVLAWADGVVSAKAYGAKGDGTTDDTAAIQAAIDDNAYGCVYFPKGVYRTTSTLTKGASPNNVRILGAGEFATSIKRDTNGNVFDLDGVGFWVFEDISIQHEPGLTSGLGLNFTGTSDSCELRNVFIVNNPSGGAHFIGTSGGQQSENKITDSLFMDNGRNGVGAQLRLEWSHDFLIRNSDFGRFGTMTGYPSHGVYILNASAGLYEGCEHWENTRAFETAGACNYLRIFNNRWEESQQENVVIGGSGAYWEICGNMQHTAGKAAKDTYAGFVLADTVSSGILRDLVSFSLDVATYRQTYGLSIAAGVNNWQVAGQKHDHFLSGAVLNSATTFGAIKWTDGSTVYVNADGVTSGLTRYLTPIGVQSSSSGGMVRSPFNGVISSFYVGADGAPGSGQTFSYRFRINNVLTGPTYTISGAASFGTGGFPAISVSVNESVTLELVTSAGAGTASHSATYVITPT